MSRVAVIGASPRVDGWALAGALVLHAGAADATGVWATLPDDVDVVVVTPAVADQLAGRLGDRLVVVLP
jgi:vacuolar-type H+-ATPase subunit F/Vma7